MMKGRDQGENLIIKNSFDFVTDWLMALNILFSKRITNDHQIYYHSKNKHEMVFYFFESYFLLVVILLSHFIFQDVIVWI